MTAATPPAQIREADVMASPPASADIAYAPPRLTGEQAGDANAAARRCRPFPIRIGGQEIEAPLHVTPTLGRPEDATAAAITCRLGAGRVMVLAPGMLVDALLTEAAGLPARDLEPDLAALLLEALLAGLLPALETAGGVPIAIEAVDWAPPEGPAAAFHCSVGLRHGFSDAALHVAADAAAWPGLRRLIDAAPKQAAPLAGLPVPLAIRIGAVRLALADLRGLEPGDVVFPDVACRAGEALVVFGDSWAHTAKRDRASIVITTPRQRLDLQDGGQWMADPDSGAEAPSAERLDDLPVTLVFELGRSELPLAAVQGLAPGAVLDLGRDPGEAVDIIANGRRIGRGQIVRVEDALGVRVVRLFGDD